MKTFVKVVLTLTAATVAMYIVMTYPISKLRRYVITDGTVRDYY